MNQVFISFFLVAVVGVFIGASADECCRYPIYSKYEVTNVTAEDFQCNEPIYLECAIFLTPSTLPSDEYVGVALARFENGVAQNPELRPLSSFLIYGTLVCNTSTEKWHFDNSTKGYKHFACAYENAEGGFDINW